MADGGKGRGTREAEQARKAHLSVSHWGPRIPAADAAEAEAEADAIEEGLKRAGNRNLALVGRHLPRDLAEGRHSQQGRHNQQEEEAAPRLALVHRILPLHRKSDVRVLSYSLGLDTGPATARKLDTRMQLAEGGKADLRTCLAHRGRRARCLHPHRAARDIVQHQHQHHHLVPSRRRRLFLCPRTRLEQLLQLQSLLPVPSCSLRCCRSRRTADSDSCCDCSAEQQGVAVVRRAIAKQARSVVVPRSERTEAARPAPRWLLLLLLPSARLSSTQTHTYLQNS